MLPASTQLLGALVRAFDAPREARTPEVRCVLQHPTTRRGFAGRHKTRNWCCPLTAFCRFLVDDDLVILPPRLVATTGHFALFVPAGVEMVRWDMLAPATRLTGRSHLRAFIIRLAPRLSMFAAAAGASLDGFLFAETPAWVDAGRRTEPLRELRRCYPKLATNVALAKRMGCDEHAVGRWYRGGRPSRRSIDELSVALTRHDAALDAKALSRQLRWHYALAALGEHVARNEGADFVTDVARILSATAVCGARSLLNSVGLDIGRAAIAAIAPAMPDPDEVLQHAERHGASSHWRADFYAVQEEERRIVGELPGHPIEALQWLMNSLPRRRARNRASRTRTARPLPITER